MAASNPIPVAQPRPAIATRMSTESIEGSPLATPDLRQHEEPLYTEIHIPLPPIPERFLQPDLTASPPKARSRGHTLHSMLPFHHRRSSSSSSEKSQPSKEKAKEETGMVGMMKAVQKGRRRSGTVEALAVVPTVLMLGTEMFTPSEEREVELKERKHEGVR
ncbi:hypothetical protein BDV96DRAFT_650449 [Lophiotrema nucula]|uniref:Uncharacterized protein n=1 Tax=Lophiotrema nucula TaxID=690887 RepID=A0A6A5YUK7_9PLEO|nr:hypothetical protein BDV96DRAFT_650449 [Lophiotrema nucula]